MEIILGKTAGFCGGVGEAIKNTEKALEQFKNICCLGELVHNKEVTKALEKKGLKIIKDIEEAEDRLILRAHGVEKQIYDKAQKAKIDLLDCTCKKVKMIHELVEEYSKKEYFIVLIGEKEHPEVVGTFSFCGKNRSKISQIEEVNALVREIQNSFCCKVLVVGQTTFNGEKFDEIVEKLQNELRKNFKGEIKIERTICNATKLRQEETIKLARQVDFMIIIGGKNSSNTNKLYELSKKYGKGAMLIETKKELEWEKIKHCKKIGIMAGVSTPTDCINEVISEIKRNIEKS